MKTTHLVAFTLTFGIPGLISLMVKPAFSQTSYQGEQPSIYTSPTLKNVQQQLTEFQAHGVAADAFDTSTHRISKVTTRDTGSTTASTTKPQDFPGYEPILTVCPDDYGLDGTDCERMDTADDGTTVHTLIYYNANGTHKLFNAMSGKGKVGIIDQIVKPVDGPPIKYTNEFVSADQFAGEVSMLKSRGYKIQWQTPDGPNPSGIYQIQYYWPGGTSGYTN